VKEEVEAEEGGSLLRLRSGRSVRYRRRRSERIIAAVVDSRASLGRRRGFLVISRTNVFHDREFPGRSSVDGVSLDRAIDLRAEVLYNHVQNQT